eukprot:2920378-Lingulodinium_polyedra.AAC.1
MELTSDQIEENDAFLRIRRAERAEHDQRVSGMTQAERVVARRDARHRAQTVPRSGGNGKLACHFHRN